MNNQVIKIKKYIHPFERILSIFAEDIVLEFRGFPNLPWDDFLLNPRRLRGSDFLMRWSQGVWSEHRLTQSINEQTKFYAIPYGPSSAAPHDNIRKFELYFESLNLLHKKDWEVSLVSKRLQYYLQLLSKKKTGSH